jgi:hypothetical protein
VYQEPKIELPTPVENVVPVVQQSYDRVEDVEMTESVSPTLTATVQQVDEIEHTKGKRSEEEYKQIPVRQLISNFEKNKTAPNKNVMPSKKRKESHPVRMDNENEQGKTL